MREAYYEDQDWETAKMKLESLQVFYLVTTVFSNIYILTSYNALHNIYGMTKYFIKI